DYMQTGKVSRGDQEFTAPCSIVLGGNIDTNLELRQPDSRYLHLFQVLPVELQDTAFLDRIHAYLPGWEMLQEGSHGNEEDIDQKARARARKHRQGTRLQISLHLVLRQCWKAASGINGKRVALCCSGDAQPTACSDGRRREISDRDKEHPLRGYAS